MMKASELENDLAQFNGTEKYYNYNLFGSKIFLTDGVKYLAENAQCYWLIDAILSYQPKCKKDKMLSQMQFWTLKTNTEKHKAILTCERDSDDIAFTQEIPYTDFPLNEIKIWIENGVMCLPQER